MKQKKNEKGSVKVWFLPTNNKAIQISRSETSQAHVALFQQTNLKF